jgi:hypothetical protein
MEYETINDSSDSNSDILEIYEIVEINIDSIDIEPIDINYNSIQEYCPLVNSRDMEYELNNTIYITGDIKCKNYELCRGALCVAPFKSNYLCDNCDTTYEKKLEIKENIECPICLDIKRCVSQPNCSHFTCVDCFKLCYYSHEIVKPVFPYTYLKDEYDEDNTNPIWNEYPLIKIYRAKMKTYIHEKKEKKKKTFLKKCPLCRK